MRWFFVFCFLRELFFVECEVIRKNRKNLKLQKFVSQTWSMLLQCLFVTCERNFKQQPIQSTPLATRFFRVLLKWSVWHFSVEMSLPGPELRVERETERERGYPLLSYVRNNSTLAIFLQPNRRSQIATDRV